MGALRSVSPILAGVVILIGSWASSALADGKAVVARPDSAGRHWALVIGINGYSHSPLNYCVKDATLLADTLRTRCGYAEDRVYLMCDGLKDFNDIPTRENILRTARLVADLPKREDTLLLYFSGHGVSVDQKGYLVPIDARDITTDKLVPIAELRKILRASKAARRVMILDACHSGGEKAAAQTAMTKSFEEALRADAEGIITLASCRAEETSLEAPWHGQGLFTYWLTRGLIGAADRQVAGNRDNRVEITELYQYVYEQVRNEAAKHRRHRQNPFMLASLSGRIELAQVTGQPSGQELAPPRGEASGDDGALPKELTLDLGGGVTMELVLIAAGEFMMGSSNGDSDEKPVHRVRISKPFWLGKYEVTQSQWQAVMGNTPSRFKGSGDLPVEKVSCEDCQQFCRKLSTKAGREVRLPTEAEWEYACRAGSDAAYCFGDSESKLGQHAWYSVNSGNKTHAAGGKQANRWGLYDMHGNVWEWCADWYDKEYYSRSPATDPTGAPSGNARVLLGGSWPVDADGCRSAVRHWGTPDFRDYSIGFRVASDAQ